MIDLYIFLFGLAVTILVGAGLVALITTREPLAHADPQPDAPTSSDNSMPGRTSRRTAGTAATGLDDARRGGRS